MRLNSSIKEVKGIGVKINIETIRDLISYFPRTYVQFPEIKRPDEVVEGETAAVIGQIRQTPIVKRVRSMQITVTSIVGMGKRLELVWFRLPYIKNSLHPGENYVFYGKVQHKNGRFVMEQPAIYTPEIFKDEEKALAFLRKEFIDNLALEDLFNIGKASGIVAQNAEFSEDAANKIEKDIDKLLQTHSVEMPYYTFCQYGAYIEYPDQYANYWHIELFEKEIS